MMQNVYANKTADGRGFRRLVALLGVVMLLCGCHEEIEPYGLLTTKTSGPTATTQNPAVATADRPVEITLTQESKYTDSDKSVEIRNPKASIRLTASQAAVRAKSVAELTAMKETSSQTTTGTEPQTRRTTQTFEIGAQTITFDLAYDVYTYINKKGLTVDIPYVKLNNARYGEAKPEAEGEPTPVMDTYVIGTSAARPAPSVTAIRLRPVGGTRGSVMLEQEFDVTVSFNLVAENVGDTLLTKQTYAFEVQYRATVETIHEFPDPETSFSSSFSPISGTLSTESPFVVNPSQTMLLEWSGQSLHSWFEVEEMEQKVFSEDPFARVSISATIDTLSTYNTVNLQKLLVAEADDPVYAVNDTLPEVHECSRTFRVGPANEKTGQQVVTVNWSYRDGSTISTLNGDVALPYITLSDPQLVSVDMEPLEDGDPDVEAHKVTVRLRQTASTVNAAEPWEEEFDCLVTYVIKEDIRLVKVNYTKDWEWVAATEDTESGICFIVYRDRAYSNGETFTDTFKDDVRPVKWTSGFGPSQYTDNGGNRSWSGRTIIYEAAAYNDQENAFSSTITVGVPDLTKVSSSYTTASDGYKSAYAGMWSEYKYAKGYSKDETSLNLKDGVEVTGADATSARVSGWYSMNTEYYRDLSFPYNGSDGFLDIYLRAVFPDSYLVIDGRMMTFVKDGRSTLNFTFSEEGTSYNGRVAKNLIHKGSTDNFFGKPLSVSAIATVYQHSGAAR